VPGLGVTVIALLGVIPPADASYGKCVDRTSTNTEWGQCGSVYLLQLDKALNVAWKKSLASMEGEANRMLLRQEQREWMKFRDSSCKYYANGTYGREGQVLDFVTCRAAIIKARIAQLGVIP
jgi:uncharacterized protein YecT (DUF1311 family)